MSDSRATYALVRARIEVRLAELREAMNRHEAEQRWDRVRDLERVEAGLAELVAEVGEA